MSAIPADLHLFIGRVFPTPDQSEALSAISVAVLEDGTTPSDRLLRCAAVASSGSILKLHHFLELLRVDWRDVIVAGEYVEVGGTLSRVRDLTKAIEDDA